MQKYLRKLVMNISVLGAYAIVGGVSLALSLVFALIIGLERLAVTNEMDAISAVVETSQAGGELAHQLQKERGMSAVYLASLGEQFGEELSAQRKVTDSALTKFNEVVTDLELGTDLSQHTRAMLKDLVALNSTRSRVDARMIEADGMIAFYSNVIKELISVYDFAVEGRVMSDLGGVGAFLRAKEAAGLERAIGSRSFAMGGYAEGDYESFISLVSAQIIHLDRFSLASGELGAGVIEAIEKSEQQQKLNDLRRLALTQKFTEVDASAYFDAASARLDLLHSYEQELVTMVGEKVQDLSATATRHLYSMIGLIICAILIVAGIIVNFARAQAAIMKELVEASKKMIDGDLTVQLPEAGSNDLSQLIRTLGMFRDATR